MTVNRKTKSVKLIMDVFNENKNAISAIYLVDHFSNKMNKTTVYRILDRLENDGILHSFIDKQGLKRYAKDSADNSITHPHFLCQDCGISTCVKVNITLPDISEYNIKSSEHLLIGTCKDCLSN